jgi:hypothetical protein
MKKEEEEYRIISPGISPAVETDSKNAGQRYRGAIKARRPGETAELQKRKVGPWETVEKSEVKE